MVHEIIHLRCLPLNYFMVSQTELFFLLQFFNRWWWRRQIIQKRLKKWQSTQNPVHHLPPLFRTPVEKKTNKQNNPSPQKKHKKRQPSPGLSTPPPPENKKKNKKLNTIFHRGYFFGLAEIPGWGVFPMRGRWHLQVFEVDQSLVGRIIGKKAPGGSQDGVATFFFLVRVWLFVENEWPNDHTCCVC